MSINYQVNAEVIDISTDQPRSSDALLVDSNVWLWMTYLGPGASTDWRSRVYPNYVKRARRAKAKLLRCGLSLCELAHQIEQGEFEVFQQSHPNERAKEFRHNYPLDRRSVATSLLAAWRIIKTMAVPLDLTVERSRRRRRDGDFRIAVARWLRSPFRTRHERRGHQPGADRRRRRLYRAGTPTVHGQQTGYRGVSGARQAADAVAGIIFPPSEAPARRFRTP